MANGFVFGLSTFLLGGSFLGNSFGMTYLYSLRTPTFSLYLRKPFLDCVADNTFALDLVILILGTT